MECVINNERLKYENGDIYLWKTMWGGRKLKVPKWVVVKGRVAKYKNYTRKVAVIGGRYSNGGKQYKWHRLVYKLHNPEWDIEDTSKNNEVDHIDRNPLNNNIENLRIVTHHQNMFNISSKGYDWHKGAKKWRVRIVLNGKEIHGGLFKTEEEAIKKREELKQKYHLIN
jgi:hypothetical protein